MPTLYPYLVSSLPMLSFGAKPPFSFTAFLGQCQQRIPDEDYALLESLPQVNFDNCAALKIEVIKEWLAFDTALRNALAAGRASRKHRDPVLYLRPCAICDLSLEHLAQAVLRTPLFLDAERMLDQARWNKLEELSLGHYFDLPVLIIYGYKLLILLRWEKIRSANSAQLLEEITVSQKGAA
ncbi:MAG: DUF2764 family protein [Candidatus Omnitrophota bacterium]